MIQILHQKLLQPETQAKLNSKTDAIIKAYRNKQKWILEKYAAAVGFSLEKRSLNALFTKTVKQFHPDNWPDWEKKINHAYQDKNIDQLIEIAALFGIPGYETDISRELFQLEQGLTSYDNWDSYQYPDIEDDSDYSDDIEYDSIYGDELELYQDEHEETVRITFVEAVCREGYPGFPNDPTDRNELMNWDEVSFNSCGLYTLAYMDICQAAVTVQLSDNHLTDIEPLVALIHGEHLDISNNKISDLTPLASWIQLKDLDASHNSITSITPLAHLTQILQLNLAYNTIQDLGMLKNLHQVQLLDLSYNKIKDASPLLALKHLKRVNLWGNPIADYSVLMKLEEQGVQVHVRKQPLSRRIQHNASES